MAAHVKKAHDFGMKYMVWYFVPFIGLYNDGRVLEIPNAKKTIVMNASGKDSFVIRRHGRLSEIACRSDDWIEFR